MTHSFRYLEDLAPGERWLSPSVTVSQADIIAFGRLYDPQPMHTDADRAGGGPFKGLVASGWHMLALAMRLLVEGRSYGGTPVVGVGADDLRWLQPVRPGDVLTLERTITAIEPPAKEGGRGTVTSRLVMRNQRGETTMHVTTLSKVPSRPRTG